MLRHVKKNDTVMVLSGRDKGKKGTVIEVAPKKDKVLVSGVCLVTRHIKARRQGETGGIKQEESYIPLSKVMPICTSCSKPCRVNSSVVENRRVRVCNRCKAQF